MAGSQQTTRLEETYLKTAAWSESKTEPRPITLREKIVTYSLSHRRMILLAAFAFVLLVEIIEQVIIINFGEGVHLVYDLVLYTLIVPCSVWLVLSILDRTEKERKQTRYDNVLRSQFSQNLGDARSWDELIQFIVEYLHRVSPAAHATLYTNNPKTRRLQPEAACDRSGKITLHPTLSINPDSLPVGSLPQLLIQNGSGSPAGAAAAAFPGRTLTAARAVPAATLPPAPLQRYDLPVTRNDQQIGVIKLEYLPGSMPTSNEIQALKGAVPVIALAMEGALLQNLAVEQAAASENQRRQIAQNLHDTLAQNIGYLRLKLDQLTGSSSIREIGVVLQELERMRTTADEAYQQVRDTLDELDPVQAEDIVTTVIKHARAISQRAGINLRTSQVGTAYSLPPSIRQQILYIAREALANIEKHACARQVHIQFIWMETELILKITDDGVGFNPLSVSSEGHYGLWIMQHRAEEIGGSLMINPVDHADSSATGTEVTLWLPHPANTAGQGD